MPIIYTSLKMAKWLGPVVPLPENPPEANTWNANIFRVQKKQWLFFIHNPTFFVLLLPEVKKADMKNLQDVFFQRWAEQLKFEGIEPELISRLKPEPVSFYRTNRHFRTIGVMTNHLLNFKYYSGSLAGRDLLPTVLNYHFNRVPTGPSPFTLPVEEMQEFLGQSPH